MSYNKISIKLNDNPSVGEQIIIQHGVSSYFIFNFVAVRSAPYEVTIGSDYVDTRSNLADSFTTDYNLTGFWETGHSSDEYYIEGVFEQTPTETINTANATVTITSETPDFEIESYTFSAQTGHYCTNVLINVTANELIYKINDGSITPAYTASQSLRRGRTYIILVENSTGVTDTITVTAPSLLNEGLITITQSIGMSDAQLFISHETGLDLEYSLDDVTYQTSNIFSNVSAGTYTLYVKGEYDCEIEIEFEVVIDGNIFLTPEAYFHISKSNSLRFAQQVTYSSTVFKTDETSLSCETDKPKKYQEKQLFTSSDIITTQFKTSYTLPIAYVDENTPANAIAISQISENMGLSEYRDAKAYAISPNVTGIYFETGNIYDYVTSAVTGTHTLNGELPEWAFVGGVMIISGVQYPITTISFNESVQSFQIEIPVVLSGSVIAGSVWNRLPYEVYEFDVDMVDHLDTEIQIGINLTSPNFTELDYLSEVINVKATHDNTVHIQYWNDENTDINIANDIRHYLRLGLEYVNGADDNEVKSLKTDDSVDIYDIANYELDVFKFSPVTKEIYRKVILSLSHQNVLINGVGYKKVEIEASIAGDNANIYNITATMIKSSGGTTIGAEGSTQIIEIPSLLEGDLGFINT